MAHPICSDYIGSSFLLCQTSEFILPKENLHSCFCKSIRQVATTLFGKYVAGNIFIAVIYVECKKEVEGETIDTKLPMRGDVYCETKIRAKGK